MVGGRIIGLARKPDGVTMLHIRANRCTDQCCIDCREIRLRDGSRIVITIGDHVWWQCGQVMWTPHGSSRQRCGVDFDICLPKVGYSYGMTHARDD